MFTNNGILKSEFFNNFIVIDNECVPSLGSGRHVIFDTGIKYKDYHDGCIRLFYESIDYDTDSIDIYFRTNVSYEFAIATEPILTDILKGLETIKTAEYYKMPYTVNDFRLFENLFSYSKKYLDLDVYAFRCATIFFNYNKKPKDVCKR